MTVATRSARISLALLLAGCQPAPADPAVTSTPTGVPAPETTIGKATATTRELVRRSPPPVRIEIPSIGVSSALVRLGLNPDGTMQVRAITASPAGSPAARRQARPGQP